MPIYEFYCPQCHAIYSFWAKRVDTQKTPACPHGPRHKLQRRVSSFAVSSGGKAAGEGGPADLPFDEGKMEQALSSLASEAEGMSDEDPRAMARMMRKLSDMAGLRYGQKMEEALGRLESGENPEAVEADMGEMMDGEEPPFELEGGKGRAKSARPPKRDDTLHEM
jgi:putative FmdB family regulatory protein